MYKIIGTYHGSKGTEDQRSLEQKPKVIDTCKNRDEAWKLLTEYQMAYGDGWYMGMKIV